MRGRRRHTRCLSDWSSDVCSSDLSKMLQGLAAGFQEFQAGAGGTMLPSDLDGPTLPPNGSPNYFAQRGGAALNVYQFSVNWTTPASRSEERRVGKESTSR